MQETTDQQRPVTIPDIAFAAGVSRTTVSMVLNGKADRYRICAATRRRVEAVISQSGYQPNRMARNMRLGQGTLVGLVLPDGTPDVGELIAGLDPILADAGYHLVIASVGTDLAAAGKRIRRLNHDGLAGLIYGPRFPVGSSPITAGLGPTIILGPPASGLPGVFHEDEMGGQLQPAGMRRSERKRGQVAGELILSVLAGAPSSNRRVTLEPLAESELLSSRVAELLKGEAEGQPVSTPAKPVSQPVMPEPSPPPVIVSRPPPIIIVPVTPPPASEKPVPVTRPDETEIRPQIEDRRPQTPPPVFEEPTPVTRPVAPETPATTESSATNNSAPQQPATAAEPPSGPAEPDVPAPVPQTPEPVIEEPAPATRPEETERPATPESPATNNSATQQPVTAPEPPPVLESEPVIQTPVTPDVMPDPVFEELTPVTRPVETERPANPESPVVLPPTPPPEPSPIPSPPTPVVAIPSPASMVEQVPEVVLESTVMEDLEALPVQAEKTKPPGESTPVENPAGEEAPPQTP